MNTETTPIVTRVNTIERDVEGEMIDTLRMFNGRKLVGDIAVDDISRYAEGEIDFDAITAFLAAKPRTVADVMDFLGEEPGDDDAEDEEGPHSIVPEKYRIRYGATQRCGDDVAETLSAYVTLPRAPRGGKVDIDGGLDRPKLREVAAKNGLAAKLSDYEDRELNGGLLRMNISNILRGMVRRGERVEIGAKVWVEDITNPKHPQFKKAAKPAAIKAEKLAKAAKAAKAPKAKKGAAK